MKTIIKWVMFYSSAVLGMTLLCSEINLAWFAWAVVDFALIAWCRKNLTLREFIRMTGYEAWYKTFGK